MFKNLFKISATFLFTLIFWSAGAMASGKMEIPLGQTVNLEAENLATGQEYKWVVNKDKEILDTQTGPVFTYTFDQQGEYKVNLSSTDGIGEVRNTTVSIMVGGRYSKPDSGTTAEVFDVPLKADFSTLPKTSEGVLHILGDQGRVVFDINSRPDVLEFRLDRNIFVDSDGDGIPNNDIDNEADRSYLVAGIWSTSYASSEAPEITAELTVVNTAGKTAKTQVKIIFDSFQVGQGEVLAVLDTLPSTEDKKIYVSGSEDTVAFYVRNSKGKVLEYRIDANIFVDSNGDGNPANDIDNQDDPSFKTGDVWTTSYKKTDQQIIAQLTVVGEGNKGSQIQREVIFKDSAAIAQPDSGSNQSSGITLVADKDLVQKGDPINFEVKGLTQEMDSYVFDWDFNGDNKPDQTTEGIQKVSYIYDQPGVQKISVQVKDKDGNQATFSKEIQVKDIQATTANFEYEIKGLVVNFKNLSTTSAALSNQNLTYTWNFGDTDEKNYTAQQDKISIENPSYTYLTPNKYQVTLTVTDASKVTSKKTIEVTLGDATVQPSEDATQTTKDASVWSSVFKIILYVLLAIVALILLSLGGLLGYLKIKHPDLVFEELIDELKIKILSLMGVHDDIEPETPLTPGLSGGVIPPYKPQQQHVPQKPVSKASEPQAETKKDTPDLTQSNAPVPEWLQPKNGTPQAPLTNIPEKNPIIEGEVLSEKPLQSPSPSTPPSQKVEPNLAAPGQKVEPNAKDLTKPDGPVPDWLKDA